MTAIRYDNHWMSAPSRHASKLTRKLKDTTSLMASGRQGVQASQNIRAATVGVGIEAKHASAVRALHNAGTGHAMLTVADAAYTQVSDALLRMRELAMRASTDTITDEQRSHLEVEFTSLASTIDEISGKTEFNGILLLDSADTYTFQVGVKNGADDHLDFALPEVSSTQTANVGGATITSAADARTALDTVDLAIENVNTERSRIGASINRLEQSEDAAWSALEGYARAKGETIDLDFAKQASIFAQQRIQLDVTASMMAQAKSMSQIPLRLIQ